ncbi:fimbrial protein [Serratia sp. AKBS12]|uniref:fimbrial protein n=1 Tax=Serratia sp. AKBS12 TaxID=2974597 RepID=UPI002166A008|nr:fimbrial protein [Serratia sp. AKBS12]MCS3408333.1 type 1 fimbrial protein [Serratia sp. AKBS12]
MKKTLIAMGMIMTACTTYSSVTLAATGTIQFQGAIIENTCTVNINGQGTNPTIILGKIDKATLATAGATSAAHRIEIKLTDCPTENESPTTVSARFAGAVDTADNTLLQLTSPDADTTAKNVAIEFTEKNNQPLPLGAAPQYSESINNGEATLLYFARYKATGAASVGTANAVADYTIVYN